MSDITLAESIYVKRSKSNLGGGATFRECVLETFWYPYGVTNGYVELFPVTDDLKRVLRLAQKVPVELFKEEYSQKENSKEIYLELKKTIR
jgi:hypothetical protein